MTTQTYDVSFSAANFVGVIYGCDGCQTPAPTDPVTGDFTITFDPTLTYYHDTTDITLNGLNIALGSAVFFDYQASNGYLGIGGLDYGWTVGIGTNDFALAITDSLTSPSMNTFVYSTASAGNAYFVSFDGSASVSPIPPAVTESLKNDTGFSAIDLITKDATVTGAGDANAVVHFTVDGSSIFDTATADGSGTWNFTPTGLGDGTHTIMASETNAVGQTGTASLTVTLDTIAPVDVITSDMMNKHGSSFTVTGTSEANAAINVYDGSTLLGSTVPDSSGQWSFKTGHLSTETVHSFTSTATDVAGNVGQSSGAAIYGTDDNNLIKSTSGNDILTGGGGTDQFVFSDAIFGKDVVTDFKPTGSNHDTLQFDHSAFANFADILAHATEVGKDVVISHDATDIVTLVGVHLNQLTAHDFLIV